MVAVITLDGPAGVGKSTLADAVASYFGFTQLSSGVLYRLIGWHALKHSQLESPQQLIDYAFSLEGSNWLGFVAEAGEKLYSKEVASAASKIAVIAELRAALLDLQRNCALSADIKGLVAEGRDMGTVVFPNAACKLFITASAEVRALRRCKQIIQPPAKSKAQPVGEPTPAMLALMTSQIIERDQRDSQRQVAPLVAAADAIVIDTSTMDLAESLAVLIEQIKKTISL